MFCSECGKESTGGEKFCSGCGFELPSEQAAQPPVQSEPQEVETPASPQSAASPYLAPANFGPNTYVCAPAANAAPTSKSKKVWMIVLLVVAGLCVLGIAVASVVFTVRAVETYVTTYDASAVFEYPELPDYPQAPEYPESPDVQVPAPSVSASDLETMWLQLNGYWESIEGDDFEYLYFLNEGEPYLLVNLDGGDMTRSGTVSDYAKVSDTEFTVSFKYTDFHAPEQPEGTMTLYFDVSDLADGSVGCSTDGSGDYQAFKYFEVSE